MMALKFCCFLATFFLSLEQCICEFKVYWNVPTEMCHKYGLNFSEVSELGVVQNTGDPFKGDKIVIMYDPGLFPALGPMRNGGVPQAGDLQAHLKQFKYDLQEAIPQDNFDGIAVIDFERWRPIWRMNWGNLDVYREYSKKLEKKSHPWLSDKAIEKLAQQRFEKFSFHFFEETLKMAKRLRPSAKWGYYAFPYCFNFTPKNPAMQCTTNVQEDNDRSKWMYQLSTGMYPSVYMYEQKLSEPKRAKMIQGRVQEAMRLSARSSVPVYPYASYKYHDTNGFLSKTDMESNLIVPKKFGASGIIIWGSSKDVNTEAKCQKLLNYVKEVFGPIVKSNTRLLQNSVDINLVS